MPAFVPARPPEGNTLNSDNKMHLSLQLVSGRLLTRLLFVVTLLLPTAAGAWSTIHRSLTAFGGEYTVPASTPPGTVIARQTLPIADLCAPGGCKLESYNTERSGYPTGDVGYIHPTSVQGVGQRLVLNGAPLYAMTNGYSDPIRVDNALELQLITTGAPIKSAALASDVYPGVVTSLVLTSWIKDLYGTEIRLSGSIRSVAGTCFVDSPTVTLSPIAAARLPTVGSSGGGAAFTLNVSKCPAGYNRVGYKLSQSAVSPAGPPGVLQASSSSSAHGVTIQLKDSSGAGLELNRSYPINEYSKTSGGSYNVSLRADYYRTAPQITVGSVNADVTVYLDYQ